MENIHLKRFQENQRKVRRPKNFRQSKSVDENSGGIRFSLQRWKPFYQRHYLRGKDFFHSLGAVLLLISCTFLVCHTPKNILNVYDLYRLAVKVRSMRSIILVEVSLHDPPPLSNLGVAADGGQPSPPHRQRLFQYLHLLPEGPKNNSVFLPFFTVFKGCLLGSQVQIWRPGTHPGSSS